MSWLKSRQLAECSQITYQGIMQRGILISLLMALVTDQVVQAAKYATCNVQPNVETPGIANQVKGTVSFQQEDGSADVKVNVDLSGFSTADAYTKHGFHVHAASDIAAGCSGAAGHFNPYNKDHAAPSAADRHVGDLGNIEEDSSGNVKTTITDRVISLNDGTSQIIGKAIVVHEKADDLGLGGDDESKKTGNAGARLACCVIIESGAASVNSFTTVITLIVALMVTLLWA